MATHYYKQSLNLNLNQYCAKPRWILHCRCRGRQKTFFSIKPKPQVINTTGKSSCPYKWLAQTQSLTWWKFAYSMLIRCCRRKFAILFHKEIILLWSVTTTQKQQLHWIWGEKVFCCSKKHECFTGLCSPKKWHHGQNCIICWQKQNNTRLKI